MNWCKKCKKELPNEAMCNVGVVCTTCQLKDARKEISALKAKLLASEAAHNEAKEEVYHLQIELGQCERKCAQSEAAGAEMRGFLEWFSQPTKVDIHLLGALCEHAQKGARDLLASTTCGTAFLAERERHVKALELAKPILKAVFVGPAPDPLKAQEAYELARTALNRK